MNVKNLTNISMPTAVTPKQGAIKSDSAHDRDANGQSLYQRNKKKSQEKMTQEQFDNAVKILNEKDFMKEMSWIAYPIFKDDIKYVEVKSPSGELIKTISEFDMWELLTGSDPQPQNKGQLLKTVA